jgi:hypothetical protein
VTIDGFLTFLTLIVAIYAVIPKVSRRTIDVKVGFVARLVAGAALALILVLELYEPIREVLRIPSSGLSRFGLHPQNVAFGILVLAGIYIGLTIRCGSIPRRRLGKLQRLIEAAIESEMFADLIDEVLAPNIAWICATSEDRAAKPGDAEIASDIVRITFTSPKLVNFIAESKPYFGITLLSQRVYQVEEFTYLYFQNLMKNRQSIFYYEVRNNQNTSTISGYDFPVSNRLLHFLFADARNAERLGVWSPIGEFLLVGPASPDLEENRKSLNRPMRDFHNTGQWTDPFATGIHFIDLMITAALVQNVQWHMWLYYFNHFTEVIIDNLDIDAPDMDPHAEWPAIVYFLIYEMFSAMTNWIRLVEHVPPDQTNIVMRDTQFDHENGNIPKSTIMVMALCFRKLILSDNVLPSFKRYIRGILMRLLKDVNDRRNLKPWSEMIVNALAAGEFGRTPAAGPYQSKLEELLEGPDISVRREAEMLTDAVRKIRGEEPV